MTVFKPVQPMQQIMTTVIIVKPVDASVFAAFRLRVWKIGAGTFFFPSFEHLFDSWFVVLDGYPLVKRAFYTARATHQRIMKNYRARIGIDRIILSRSMLVPFPHISNM